MSKTDFQNGFALGLVSGGVVEKESATATLTVAPNLKGTADTTPSGSVEIIEG